MCLFLKNNQRKSEAPASETTTLVNLSSGWSRMELRTEPVGFARGGAVPDRDQFHPMLSREPAPAEQSTQIISEGNR
jgi:hypothetical protein